LLELGRLHLAAGDWDVAARYLEDAAELAGEADDLQKLVSIHQLLAELDIRADRAEAVPPRLQPLLERLGRQVGASALLATIAWAHLELANEASGRS
jgi:uncharacterized protein HemY